MACRVSWDHLFIHLWLNTKCDSLENNTSKVNYISRARLNEVTLRALFNTWLRYGHSRWITFERRNSAVHQNVRISQDWSMRFGIMKDISRKSRNNWSWINPFSNTLVYSALIILVLSLELMKNISLIRCTCVKKVILREYKMIRVTNQKGTNYIQSNTTKRIFRIVMQNYRWMVKSHRIFLFECWTTLRI